MIWATASPGLVFADCVELLHLCCKEYNQSDFGIDYLVMSMCRVISCVVGRGCLLWGDGIVKLFQILKDDAVKVLHSVCQQIWKTQQWPQDWKRSVFISIPKKGNAKECLNYCTIAHISHASEGMLKILQARLQQYVNHELPDVQAGFRKGRGTREQISNICWIIEKAREFQKNICFCFIDNAKAFDCVDHNKLWKILWDGNTRPPDLPPEKSVCRSRSNS